MVYDLSVFFRHLHGISTDIMQIRIESMASASCKKGWGMLTCPPVQQKSKVITMLGILETLVALDGAIVHDAFPVPIIMIVVAINIHVLNK